MQAIRDLMIVFLLYNKSISSIGNVPFKWHCMYVCRSRKPDCF